VVDNQQCLLGSPNREAGAPQASERLWAIHFVYDVSVDIEQARAVRFLGHEVIVPDLVIEGMTHHARLLR
jgi:hypothetical protein